MVGKLSFLFSFLFNFFSFVSEIIKTFTLSLIWEIRNSNLFLKEFIFKWAIINLFTFFGRILVFSSLVVWFCSDVDSLSDCGALEDAMAILALFSSKHQLKFLHKNLHTMFVKQEHLSCLNAIYSHSYVEFSKFSSGQVNISFHAKF